MSERFARWVKKSGLMAANQPITKHLIGGLFGMNVWTESDIFCNYRWICVNLQAVIYGLPHWFLVP